MEHCCPCHPFSSQRSIESITFQVLGSRWLLDTKVALMLKDVSLLLTKYFQFLWQGKFDMNLWINVRQPWWVIIDDLIWQMEKTPTSPEFGIYFHASAWSWLGKDGRQIFWHLRRLWVSMIRGPFDLIRGWWWGDLGVGESGPPVLDSVRSNEPVPPASASLN